MALELITTFATEGGPLLLADVAAAAHWTGREPTPPLVVAYGGASSARLPEPLRPDAGKHGQERPFSDVAAAKAFAAEVIAAFQSLHPNAARPAQWPDYPGFYEGAQRVFTVEVKASNAYDKLVRKLKEPLSAHVFDRAHKASALFVANEPGRGLIAVNRERGVIAVVGALTATDEAVAPEQIVAQLDRMQPEVTKTKTKLELAGEVVLFPAAFSSAQLRQANPEPMTGAGPLRAPLQATPIGAFFGVPAATYSCAHGDAAFGAQSTECLVWLVAQ